MRPIRPYLWNEPRTWNTMAKYFRRYHKTGIDTPPDKYKQRIVNCGICKALSIMINQPFQYTGPGFDLLTSFRPVNYGYDGWWEYGQGNALIRARLCEKIARHLKKSA